jgi:hypothetical protein
MLRQKRREVGEESGKIAKCYLDKRCQFEMTAGVLLQLSRIPETAGQLSEVRCIPIFYAQATTITCTMSHNLVKTQIQQNDCEQQYCTANWAL